MIDANFKEQTIPSTEDEQQIMGEKDISLFFKSTHLFILGTPHPNMLHATSLGHVQTNIEEDLNNITFNKMCHKPASLTHWYKQASKLI